MLQKVGSKRLRDFMTSLHKLDSPTLTSNGVGSLNDKVANTVSKVTNYALRFELSN